ncbi:integrase [Streptomyces sp. 8L]|uniref:integrase n=1 Tax=Streptomyces sp. 8L TaxID=2877242 RepID=UPI001CD682E4|nr:integrase [Streptomyces sp. 8L]MCA1217841.1 integrase [Streptomyces sp. 8L]
MTLAPALGNDSYLLAPPSPTSPVVLKKWISRGNTNPNGLHQDPVWPLGPLIDNPSASLVKVHWRNCPAELTSQVKQVSWLLLNGELRPSYLTNRGIRARARGSADEMRETCGEWMRLARWLHTRGINKLQSCTDAHWSAYTAQRFTTLSRHSAEEVLSRLTDMWAFDQLCTQPVGVPQPPWDREGVDNYLPASDPRDSGENSTEPLDPSVLGPLLVWAIRMIDDFADDILAAWQERNRLNQLALAQPSTPEGLAALDAYLLPRLAASKSLPTTQNRGRTVLASKFIAATVGCSVNQVSGFRERHHLDELQPGPCPLQSPVTGEINGKPWREHIDFNEVTTLMKHLATAAMIICLYLTGMRPQEVQGMRSGCCPDPENGSRHLIRSHHYKTVTDDDGNHVSGGEEREVPWVAITPVVHAIRVLERIVPAEALLFDATHHDFARSRKMRGALKNGAMNQRIEEFITWVNQEAERHSLRDQHVPKDPHGAIGLARFRRTLAWHIARRPGGLIALAIQYGHMRTVLDARTSSGYGSRSRRGIHSALDIETALAAADTAAQLRDRLAAGEKISGPAARRAITAAAEAPRFEGRIVTAKFAKQAADYLARDGLVLFDNPDACLICVFKRDNALCEPGPDATAPNQYDCRPGCGNAIRLDSHADQLIEGATLTEQLAAVTPEPLAARLRAAAQRDQTTADGHHAAAQPAEALS